MGSLRAFDLPAMIAHFGCRYLFETGTGVGEGVAYALQFPFERIFSVEIHPDVAATARDRFAGDPRVEILTQSSEAALLEVLPRISGDGPVLFWLDAHFPGADYGFASYSDVADHDLRLPLARELDAIGRLRYPSRDLVLVDDLRIYEDAAYEKGPMPASLQTLPPDLRNVDFAFRPPWSETHDAQRFLKDNGYLVLTPKPR